MPGNNQRTPELLIGKLPRPKQIAYRRIEASSDDDLMYEKIKSFSGDEPIRAYIVRPKNTPNHRLPVVYSHHQRLVASLFNSRRSHNSTSRTR